MARCFRDLIDFLLAEIALCGDQGRCSLLILIEFCCVGFPDVVCNEQATLFCSISI